MEIAAFVQAKNGSPLMPVKHYGRVRRLLRSGKARVVNRYPLTIRLTYEIEDPATEPLILGIDPGRKNIGLCVIDTDCKVYYAADVETRNKEIVTLMKNRKNARKASRRGERLRRKRRAKKNGTLIQETTMGVRLEDGRPIMERILPHYKKPVKLKDIRNTEAKFCNRKRGKGWLTPTARQLLQTHCNLVKMIQKILPIQCIVLEVNKFTFARMDNPDIRPEQFAKGPLYGYLNLHDAVDKQQEGHCLFCKKKIDHYHHVIPLSRGGSDTIANTAGLCDEHHDRVHKEAKWHDKMVKEKEGLIKKYGDLSVLNQIIPFLLKKLPEMAEEVYITKGYDTKELREQFNLPKKHHVDAWCIAASVCEDPHLERTDYVDSFDKVYRVVQFRRHDRTIIKRTESRKYYLDGKLVATNRHKATMAVPKKKKGEVVIVEEKQDVDSLEEFRIQMIKEHGASGAEKIISRLTVNEKRCYQNRSRVMPGAVCETKSGNIFVMQGQHNNCERYYETLTGDKKTTEDQIKQELSSLRKKLKKQKKDGLDPEEIISLEKEILEKKKILPKAAEYQKSICRVLRHNRGLVTIPD